MDTEMEITARLFRESLADFKVSKGTGVIDHVVKIWSEPGLRSGHFIYGKGLYTTIPVDKWSSYRVSDDDLHLHLKFKDFKFPNGNDYLDLEFESYEKLREDLSRMVEWAGK
jgi:hypothetical protein